ncbi:CHAT domain-containing protein [Kordia jejudonensis]|uniref:CHAT domain-containing protein n=1 Tax=Kordia jejudonensis TaxID=1348245 RepID=UPI0006296F61|nr:CHAT domain-containing tetratricopeptide repeat protein [Kordia jejudonensis]
MIIFNSKTHKFTLTILFLLVCYSLQGQTIELSKYYYEQTNLKEFTLVEKEQLVDSLLLQENIKVDTLELVKIYRSIIRELVFSDLKKSFSYIDEIEKIAIELGDPDIESFEKNRLNKIVFLNKDQQYYKCLNTISDYFKRYPNESINHGKVYRIVGNIYSKLGDFKKATDNYDKSISILKKVTDSKLEDIYKQLYKTLVSKLELLVNDYDSKFMSEIVNIEVQLDSIGLKYDIKVNDKVVAYWNLGSYYDSNKFYLKAKNSYQKSLQLSHSIEDSSKTSISYMNLGIISKKEDEFSVAKEYLNKSLIYAKDDMTLMAMISNNFADIYQIENNHKKALIHYQKAITQALQIKDIDYQKLPNYKDLQFSVNKIDVLGYLIDKANGWIAYYDVEKKSEYLENALETFTLADQLIDIIYVESREDLSKLFWRKKGATFYPKAVEVCNKLQQPEKAFSFMEKNKAMVLLENMTNATAKRLSKLPENILEREQNLIKAIKTIESEIQEYTNKENPVVDSLKNNVFQYKKEYTAFIDSLETEFPKYYNYKKNINTVKLEEVQKQLKSDELILQYIVGKEKGFVTLINAEKIQLKELPITKELIATATTYKNAVSKPFVNTNDKNTYTEVAKKLYQQLIPFDDAETLLQQKKITIIADGILQYIPFEALLTSNEEYFIKSAEIHYNYSLSSAAQSQQNATKIPKNFIAIAPTKFKNDQFGALATSTDELEQLTDIFNANHFQYEKATKERFKKAYGNYKIVHLSTHGGINNTIPWMAFHDEIMTLDELYFTKNQSELVVLSACKTSDGELKKGEGVMSLARGFFNAGAKSVVSSLWDINEKASNDIIQEFYKNIINGDTKSEALQKAKLTYIEQNKNTSEASPYYWSALTITGDVQPIKNLQNYNYIYYSFASIFLIVLGVSIRRKRKKGKTA